MYLGRNPAVGTQRMLDSIESQFNGVLTTFDLRYGGVPTYPTLSASLIVSLGGVLQEPGEAYYVSSDKIVFSEPPVAATECWILLYSQYGTGVGAAQNGTLGAETLVLTGELHGPANFVIDPAAVGDDTGTVEIKGNLTVQGTTTTINSTTVDLDHISLGDNEIANFGDGNDLRIYHDGSHSYIADVGTGDLILQGGNDLILRDPNSNEYIRCNETLGVEINYNGSQRLLTTNTGITVTGLEQINAGSVSIISVGTIRNVLTISETGTQSSTGQRILFNNSEQNWEQGAITAIRESSSNNFSLSLSSSSGGTNVERLRITGSGNVGIGTTNPTQKLHLYTSSGTNLVRTETAANSTIGLEIVKTGSTTQSWRIVDGQTVNGKLEFYDVTAGATRMIISGSSGNVGIGTINPAKSLHATGEVQFSTNTKTHVTHLFTTGNADDGKYIIKNVANSDKVVLNTNGLTYFTGGNVGIGIDSANNGDMTLNDPRLHVLYSTDTTGSYDLVARFQSGGDANYTGGAILINHVNDRGLLLEGGRGLDNTAIAHLGLVDNVGTNSRVITLYNNNVGIGTTNPSYKLDVNGQINTQQGSSLSYSIGETYQIWNDNPEVAILDAPSAWRSMKSFIASKSGNLRLKFSGYIESGSYYWAWRIINQNASVVASGHYNSGLDTGETSAVHSYRRFVADLTTVQPGDEFTLQMVSADAGGNALLGVTATSPVGGQRLFAKEFRAYSTTPSLDHGGTTNVWGKYVGIGTTLPTSSLHVESPWSASSSTNDIATFARSGNLVNCVIGYDEQLTDMYIGTKTSHSLQFRTGDARRVIIDTSGNVGIGTTNPQQKLSVYGNVQINHTGKSLYLNAYPGTQDNTVSFEAIRADFTTGASVLEISTKDNTDSLIRRFRITDVGNVSISSTITVPNTRLEVSESNSVNQPAISSGAGATSGSFSFATRYSGENADYIANILSTNYATGRSVYGHGVRGARENETSTVPSTSGFVSTFDNFSGHRTAITQHTDGFIRFFNSGSSLQTTVGSEVVMSERLTIGATGNVGIGTTNPQRKLDVRGGACFGYDESGDTYISKIFSSQHDSANRNKNIRIGLQDGSFAGMQVQNVQGSNASYNSQNVVLLTHNGAIVGDYPSVFCKYDGQVGIGTNNPIYKLQVNGGVFAKQGNSSILFAEYNNGSIIWMDGADGDITGGDYWGVYAQSSTLWGVNYAGGTNILNITSSGNVGIGTTNPLTKLMTVGTGLQLGTTNKYIITSSLENTTSYNGIYLGYESGVQKGLIYSGGLLGSIGFCTFDASNVPQERLTIKSDGNVGIGTTNPSTKLDVNSDSIRVVSPKTPTSATDTGVVGQICWDANYVYVCVATNTWKRSALSSW